MLKRKVINHSMMVSAGMVSQIYSTNKKSIVEVGQSQVYIKDFQITIDTGSSKALFPMLSILQPSTWDYLSFIRVFFNFFIKDTLWSILCFVSSKIQTKKA